LNQLRRANQTTFYLGINNEQSILD
jgi:hypothetical protein